MELTFNIIIKTKDFPPPWNTYFKSIDAYNIYPPLILTWVSRFLSWVLSSNSSVDVNSMVFKVWTILHANPTSGSSTMICENDLKMSSAVRSWQRCLLKQIIFVNTQVFLITSKESKLLLSDYILLIIVVFNSNIKNKLHIHVAK